MRRYDLRRGSRTVPAYILVATLLGGCDIPMGSLSDGNTDETGIQSDDTSSAAIGLLQRRNTNLRRMSEEKDTLIQTLHTAMMLFNELTSVEREIAGAEVLGEEPSLQPWDDRVRLQLDRLRNRYGQLAEDLSRAERRLGQLETRDRTMRASLEEALRNVATLREDNLKKQALIDDLSLRLETLTNERDAAVKLSVARGDTIQALTQLSNTVYWVAGRAEDLRRLGLIQSVGGSLLGGGVLTASRRLDTAHFQAIDRRQTLVLPMPDVAEYEIVTSQNMVYLDPSTARRGGQRWFVRNELRITDPRFWDPMPYLILVRR